MNSIVATWKNLFGADSAESDVVALIIMNSDPMDCVVGTLVITSGSLWMVFVAVLTTPASVSSDGMVDALMTI